MAEIKILIVDDSTAKSKRIKEAVSKAASYDMTIEVVMNAFDAKKTLQSSSYDLLILDVVLPRRAEEQPTKDGGIELLRELMSRDNLRCPGQIVGLTAYPDVFHEAAGQFSDYTWAVIKYDEASDGWADPLIHLLKHIAKSKRQNSATPLQYESDLCLITALREPEFKAYEKLGWKWEEITIPSDPSTYYEAQVELQGHSIRVVASFAPRMGMVTSAVLASNMIHHFRPRIIAMTGICAGFKDQTDFGDIVIADPSWDYQSGKITSHGFELAPHQIALCPAIRRRLTALLNRGEVLQKAKENWTGGNAPRSELQALIGPFASGSAVLSQGDRLKELRAQHRQLIAADMEVYGLYAAAAEATDPAPFAVAMKGVSDFGDEDKKDGYREYAAFTSASLFTEFVKSEYVGLLQFWSKGTMVS